MLSAKFLANLSSVFKNTTKVFMGIDHIYILLSYK